MKKNKMALLMILCFMPSVVFAKEVDWSILPVALMFEVFVSLHISAFVLNPLSKIFTDDQEESKKLFWKLFVARALILLIFDFFITPMIFLADFFSVFIGGIIIIPLLEKLKGKQNLNIYNPISFKRNNLQCSYCNKQLKDGDKFCSFCGNPVNPINQEENNKIFVSYDSFDDVYKQSEDKLLEEFIKKELKNANVDENVQLIPQDVLKRKKIMILIFSILLFVFVSAIFFHFPIITYVIFVVILIVMFMLVNRYNFMKYLKKEVKSRPEEKMSNIVMSVKKELVRDDSLKSLLGCMIAAILLPMIIFFNPRIMYEAGDGGYYVRFYTFGVMNFKTATIPDNYKGKPVIGLRGNTFSNMFFLQSVTLPDSIKEIRGQAFKNDNRLTNVKLPSKLEYLGGGAFYGCESITNIELPDTLSYMGGETFKNAKSLKSVKLSKNMTEIRGNSFENCESLQTIDIPDNVVRIGGHAFYGCSSLTSVGVSESSKLREIGSSAFRRCSVLRSITLPRNVSINARSFKESPTVIKYYNLSQMMDLGNFDRTEKLYFKRIGSNNYINTSNISSKIYNVKIKLSDIKKDILYYKYTVELVINGSSQTYELTAADPYAIVNDNLVIYIEDKMFFTNYEEGFSLRVYYN